MLFLWDDDEIKSCVSTYEALEQADDLLLIANELLSFVLPGVLSEHVPLQNFADTNFSALLTAIQLEPVSAGSQSS